ncbi:MAG: hypothetical protein QOE77_2188 [Blastocatellia bacterium]|jgi:glyoxylase-like metal-dependent hydrolase (beta-lactamase superfamily II)/8-oxo-dGTP pyrophosphatase MutT (NUDIX family)|nr:hypothetical protein [Blastocatellia bacterium]
MTESSPKDAAAVILLRQPTDPNDPEVFWVRRHEKLSFLGGFHAFPGGKMDPPDTEVTVANCHDAETAAAISCAARELFEEVGVLLARGVETLTKGQRASVLDDLESGRMTWPALLLHYALYLDADDFTFVGRWVTPPFSAKRFDTWFFLAHCPQKQEPSVTTDGELESGEWISARAAYARWQRSEVLAVPPVLHALQTLSAGLTGDLVSRFLATPNAHREPTRRIEFRPNYICFPVRTPTRPPATHTNCYLIYTSSEILILDPGSPYEEEQQALADCVSDLRAEDRSVNGIVLTHLHPDHVRGVNALRDYLGGNIEVTAHPKTVEAISDIPGIQPIIDEDRVMLDGEPPIEFLVLHTPGHARGHICLYEERTGTLISGDNVLGLGSVLIDPPQGNMREYLQSLHRMRSLPNLSVIFPGHGPAIANPYAKIDEYIAHRLDREAKILTAVRGGAEEPSQIVTLVYTDVSPKLHGMAQRAVIAHLDKLETDGRVRRSLKGNYTPA